MYKATRDLINARQPHAMRKMEVVKVKKNGGGVANDCHNNAFLAFQKDPAVMVVSGWLVAPMDKRNNSTAIVAHFWNVKDGKHFDTTPGISSDYEYVTDKDLHAYVFEHYCELDSCLSMSLYYKNDEYELVDGIDGIAYPFGKVYELTTEALFDRNSRIYRFYHAMHLRHAA